MKANLPVVDEPRLEEMAYPEQFDEAFFREVQYCLNDEVVNGWFAYLSSLRPSC